MTDTTRRRFLSSVAGSAVAGAALASVGRTAGSGPASEVPVTTATAGAGPSFAEAEEFEAFVDEMMRERVGETTPGMAVAVVEGDDVVLAKGYGYADTEARLPVEADETTFPVGSVSKAVTFTGVMQAAEEGLVELDADVNTYLDDSPVDVPETYDQPVTLDHLGTHTAGFESLVPRFFTDPDELTSIETALVEMDPDRVRPPGETVEYSNYGAMLAGYILAQVRSGSFESVMRSGVFDPLGMDHSTFAQPVPDDHPGTLAKPYEPEGDSFVRTEEGFVNPRPAGSLTATATDMAAFMRAHLGTGAGGDRRGAVGDARILQPDTVDAMHDVHHVRHPAVNNWRYGFYEAGPVGAGLVTHSGGTPNTVSELVLVPDRELGFFVAYNTAPSRNVMQADILRVLREYDLVSEPGPPAPTTDRGRTRRAETVAGEYSPTFLYDDGPAQVMERLGRLSVTAAGKGRISTSSLSPRFGDGVEWVEVDPYVYREAGGSDVLAFDVVDGAVENVYMSSIPVGAYEPVSLPEQRLVTAGIVGASVGGFGLSLAGRGARRAWQRATGSRESGGSGTAPAGTPDGDEASATEVKQ